MKNKFDFQPKLFTALRNYSKERFMTDLMAGIIVGIVALPLAIAFGIASGVSPEKGLITAIIGGFIVNAYYLYISKGLSGYHVQTSLYVTLRIVYCQHNRYINH